MWYFRFAGEEAARFVTIWDEYFLCRGTCKKEALKHKSSWWVWEGIRRLVWLELASTCDVRDWIIQSQDRKWILFYLWLTGFGGFFTEKWYALLNFLSVTLPTVRRVRVYVYGVVGVSCQEWAYRGWLQGYCIVSWTRRVTVDKVKCDF